MNLFKNPVKIGRFIVQDDSKPDSQESFASTPTQSQSIHRFERNPINPPQNINLIAQQIPLSNNPLKVIRMPNQTYVLISKKGNAGGFGKCYIARVLKNPEHKDMPKYVIIKKMNAPTYYDIRPERLAPGYPKQTRNLTNCFAMNKEVNYLRKAGWKVFDTLDYNGNYYVVTELMDTDLLNYINKHSYNQPISVCYHIISECVNELANLHEQQIGHLDIKPENIFMGNTGKIKIGDLGLANKLNPKGYLHGFGGTLSYMSPERIQARQTKDPTLQDLKVDIWALGLSLENIFMRKSSIIRGTDSNSINSLHQEFTEWYKKTQQKYFNNHQSWAGAWDSLHLDNHRFSKYFLAMKEKEIAQWQAIGLNHPEPVITRTILYMLNPEAKSRPTASELKNFLESFSFNQESIKQQAIDYIAHQTAIADERTQAMAILKPSAQVLESNKQFTEIVGVKVKLPQ